MGMGASAGGILAGDSPCGCRGGGRGGSGWATEPSAGGGGGAGGSAALPSGDHSDGMAF